MTRAGEHIIDFINKVKCPNLTINEKADVEYLSRYSWMLVSLKNKLKEDNIPDVDIVNTIDLKFKRLYVNEKDNFINTQSFLTIYNYVTD